MAKVKTNQKIKKVLISQPDPGEDSPYRDLIEKFGVKIEFRKFIDIEGVSLNEFRKQGVNPLDYDGIIFTSKMAIDHFFRIVKELKTEMPPDMKYYCVSEATAKYLQKYIVIRKRKLFVGELTSLDLTKYIKKFSSEKFLYPCSAIHTTELTDYMTAQKVNFGEAVIYNTVSANLTGLTLTDFDLICFFSPSGVEAIVNYFPDFKISGVRVGVFGPTTARAALEAGLKVDIQAPRPDQPSMAGAIEDYVKANPE